MGGETLIAFRSLSGVIDSPPHRWPVVPTSSASAPPARFGPFEVDFRAGELLKNGRRIRLQDQPLQVLAVLLERPGNVVTRDEFRQQLWPNDTFVDFDHGLNNAINRLRDALNDSAEAPRFIETLPRRGYRFIAEVDGGETFSRSFAQPCRKVLARCCRRSHCSRCNSRAVLWPRVALWQQCSDEDSVRRCIAAR